MVFWCASDCLFVWMLFLCRKMCICLSRSQVHKGLHVDTRTGEQVGSCSEKQTSLGACLPIDRSHARFESGSGVQRSRLPLVKHLASHIELKDAGGTLCHRMQQRPGGQAASTGADPHSDDPIPHLVSSPSHLTREHFCMGFSSVCIFDAGDKSDCVRGQLNAPLCVRPPVLRRSVHKQLGLCWK